MSEDKKTEKKIAKRREDILFWLKAAEKYANQYKQAVDEKKRQRVKRVCRVQRKAYSLQSTQPLTLEALLTIFQKPCPRNSLKSGTKCLEMQILMILPLKKEIQRIKKMLNEDLKEAMEKYSYDPEEPIEEKRKNKLFIESTQLD